MDRRRGGSPAAAATRSRLRALRFWLSIALACLPACAEPGGGGEDQIEFIVRQELSARGRDSCKLLELDGRVVARVVADAAPEVGDAPAWRRLVACYLGSGSPAAGMALAAALEEREATWPGARRGTVAALVVALRAQGHPSKERIRVLADSLARETAFDPNDPRVITLAGGGPESIQELVAEYVARTTGDIFSPLLVYPAAHALAWAIGDLVGEEDVAHLAPMFRFDQVCLATFALRNLRSDQARALILREVRSGGAPSRIYDALRPYARDPEVAEFVLGGLQNWQSDRERVRIPGYARLARWGDVRPAIPYLEEALQEALEGGGGWTREESLAAFGMELVRWGRKAGMDGVLAAMDRYVRDRSTWERAIDAPWGTTVLQVFEFFNWVAGEQIAETSGEPVMDAAALARLSAWWASVRDAIQFDEATGRWSRP